VHDSGSCILTCHDCTISYERCFSPVQCATDTFLACSGHIVHDAKSYRIFQPIRCTVIFLLGILEEKNNECILILVIYWKKTGLLHTKISNHNIIYINVNTHKTYTLRNM
jgi:hypothetical protein